MSELIEAAKAAPNHIEGLFTDMVAGGHPDNAISLGTLSDSSGDFQIQLLITRNPSEFLDEG